MQGMSAYASRRRYLGIFAAAFSLLAGCAGGDNGGDTEPGPGATNRTTASAGGETATEGMIRHDTSQPLTSRTNGNRTSNDGSSSSETVSGAVAGWLSDAAGYDGTVVNATGRKRVTVSVGAASPSGPYAFAPAAVSISTGTTVVWEWTGEGGSHNVVAESGAFESDLIAEDGYTFKHAFDTASIYRCVCEPHESLGMKGAIIVE